MECRTASGPDCTSSTLVLQPASAAAVTFACSKADSFAVFELPSQFIMRAAHPVRLSVGTRSRVRCCSLASLSRKPQSFGTRIRSSATPGYTKLRVAQADVDTTTYTSGKEAEVNWNSLSYNKQYDEIFSKPLNVKQPVGKPSKGAQAQEAGSKKVLFSDVWAVARRPGLFSRALNSKDVQYTLFLGSMHALALLAPFTFSWPMLWLFVGSYLITGCLGITLSYHRQLSHKSFQTPKWLEYVLAYCGASAIQGDPIEWVSAHRYHHLHTDTPLDPHSPYEGFWWSHLGWLLDNQATMERIHLRTNASDLEAQPFYRFLRDTYTWHVAAQLAALYLLGGLPALVWGGALRLVWVYHITWFVNSASHCWGYQSYNTGDLSRNNWWVSLLAFGEGWHNNHHAFEFSARHGLEWWQFDVTWMVIKSLEAVGLASNVKLPSESQKARLAFPKA